MDSDKLQDAILDSNLPDGAKVHLVKNLKSADAYYQQAYALKNCVVLLAGALNGDAFHAGTDIRLGFPAEDLETLKNRGLPETKFSTEEDGSGELLLHWTPTEGETKLAIPCSLTGCDDEEVGGGFCQKHLDEYYAAQMEKDTPEEKG